MRKRHETEIVGTQLRLREGLRQRVLRESEKNGRSLNAELVHRIERSFEYDEKKDALLKQQDASIERIDTAERIHRKVEAMVDALTAAGFINASPDIGTPEIKIHKGKAK